MAVVTNLLSRLRVRATIDGKVVTESYLVTGLTGTSAAAQIDSAVENAGIPSYGAAHAEIAGVFVTGIEGEPKGIDSSGNPQAIVTVTYSKKPATSSFDASGTPDDDGPAVKQVRGSLVSVQTQLDAAGSKLETSRPGTLLNEFEDPTRLHTVTKQVPAFVITFERLEENPPLSRARSILGKRNTSAAGPYAAKTLLCTRIDSVSRDGGASYETTYEFIYDPDLSHDVELVYTLRNGQVAVYDPLDAGDDDAHQTFEIYEDTSYTPLDLDFTD